MHSTFSVLGLLLTIVGAAILTWGGIGSVAAHIRQADSIAPGRWYQNVVVWLARQLASKNPLATIDAAIPAAVVQFWGFVFILAGTVFQIIGTFK